MNCPHCGAANSDDARFCGACGRATAATEPSYKDLGPPAAPVADLTGREIAGRYRVLAKLGEGGMGAVYRGEQISLKRKVAIKVLRPELSRDPGLVRRFNAEAELAAKLSHPNTVNIYDFGQDADGALFIAMEYLEGRSLRQVMTQEGPLPLARTLAIMRQICASLADAHAHGIVHRDLKPDNVMLTERGRDRDIVRVLDFGIAKLRDDDRQTVNAMTRAGDLVGTPQYMAPEQIRGEPVDGRTDIYALGALLYEMVTGRLPFEGATVMAILSKHLMENPEPPTVRRPDLGLPPAIDALVMSALAKLPAQRPPTMEALGELVAGVAAHIGAPLAPHTAPTTAQQPAAPWSGQQAAVPSYGGSAAGYAVAPVMHPSAGAPMAVPPSGPPPGVPRTYPPGVLRARPLPGAPLPATPMMTPGPQATVARRSKAPLVIALVVVLGAGAAVAIYLGTRKSDQGSTSGTDTPGTDDPWAGRGTGDHGTPPPPPPPPPPEASWGTYQDPGTGWSLRIPPGVSTTPVLANGSLNFSGQQGTANVTVGVMAAPNQVGNPTTQQLDQVAAALATQLGARIVESGYAMTGNTNRYRVVMATAVDKGEARFYIEPAIVMVAYYTRNQDWDEKSAERREFFEGVSLPGGGM